MADPGFPVGGGANLRCVHFSAKMHAKTKEMDPVGGGGHAPAAPPGSANDALPLVLLKLAKKRWPPCAAASVTSHVSPALDRFLDPLLDTKLFP